MKRILSLGFVVLCLAMGPVGSAQDKSEWRDLLAGGLSANWTTAGNWKLGDDGVLALEPRPGEKGWQRFDAYLWTKFQVTDFEADFEYKVAKNGNSGFYFRVGDLKEPVKNGIEVQIYDTPSGGAPRQAQRSRFGRHHPGCPADETEREGRGRMEPLPHREQGRQTDREAQRRSRQ